MTLDNILQQWKEDGPIDASELANEATQQTPKLHHKYLKLHREERLRLRKLEFEFKRLKLAKYKFYTEGPSKETQELGWEFPARGKILKPDVPMYLEGDKELGELQLKIDYAKEKVETLKDIVDQINGRSYLIGHAIADIRWKGGN